MDRGGNGPLPGVAPNSVVPSSPPFGKGDRYSGGDDAEIERKLPDLTESAGIRKHTKSTSTALRDPILRIKEMAAGPDGKKRWSCSSSCSPWIACLRRGNRLERETLPPAFLPGWAGPHTPEPISRRVVRGAVVFTERFVDLIIYLYAFSLPFFSDLFHPEPRIQRLALGLLVVWPKPFFRVSPGVVVSGAHFL